MAKSKIRPCKHNVLPFVLELAEQLHSQGIEYFHMSDVRPVLRKANIATDAQFLGVKIFEEWLIPYHERVGKAWRTERIGTRKKSPGHISDADAIVNSAHIGHSQHPNSTINATYRPGGIKRGGISQKSPK